MHARKHARTHARTRSHTHTHTHTQVCREEMWHTIVRRGLPENVGLVLMVSSFAALNAAAWLAEGALSLASFGRRPFRGFACYS